MTQQENTQALKRVQEETVNKVLEHVQSLQEAGDLKLPENYVPGNALKMAWLKLQTVVDKQKRPALQVCTKASICNALLEMVLSGMNVAKKHGDFIVYGNQLTWQPEYFGRLMVAKRDAGVKEVNPQVIYEGDEYEVLIDHRGIKSLSKHTTKLENVKKDKIQGAYAIVEYQDGGFRLVDMTIEQIQDAWRISRGGIQDAHKKFPDQMAMKTVINRAVKIAANSSDDEGIMGDYVHPSIKAKDEAIKEGANKTMLNEHDEEAMIIEDEETLNGDPEGQPEETEPEDAPEPQTNENLPEYPPGEAGSSGNQQKMGF